MQTTVFLKKGVRFNVLYNDDEKRVQVNDFVTHVTHETEKLQMSLFFYVTIS